MINVVIDTNIIVSAALTPQGNPAKVVDAIFEKRDMQYFYSSAIFAEYVRVLAYPQLNIANETQNKIIDKIKEVGVIIEPTVSNIPLPDESDRIFYDTAKASGAILITGNIKHFPAEPFIITRRRFIAD